MQDSNMENLKFHLEFTIEMNDCLTIMVDQMASLLRGNLCLDIYKI